MTPEITPEMLKAALDAIYAADHDLTNKSSIEKMARKVFAAMLERMPRDSA